MAGFARRREYAFFIRRALETKPFLRLVRGGGSNSADVYWQDMLIMGHEIAHAIDPTSPLGDALHRLSFLNVSAALGDAIASTNAALELALAEDRPPIPTDQRAFPNVDLKLLAASLLQGGYDEAKVAEALRDHADTPRFLDEAACDAFGLMLVQLALSSTADRIEPEIRVDHFADVLLAAYRTFLNMRFTSYATDAARVTLADRDGPLNPIALDSLIEFSLRGRLAARSVVDSWLQLTGQDPDGEGALSFIRGIETINGRHTDRLFLPFNELLEMTLFKADFIASLDDLLDEDGFTARDFDEDPFRTLRAVDGFWRVVAA